jgi:hypothetical protein
MRRFSFSKINLWTSICVAFAVCAIVTLAGARCNAEHARRLFTQTTWIAIDAQDPIAIFSDMIAAEHIFVFRNQKYLQIHYPSRKYGHLFFRESAAHPQLSLMWGDNSFSQNVLVVVQMEIGVIRTEINPRTMSFEGKANRWGVPTVFPFGVKDPHIEVWDKTGGEKYAVSNWKYECALDCIESSGLFDRVVFSVPIGIFGLLESSQGVHLLAASYPIRVSGCINCRGGESLSLLRRPDSREEGSDERPESANLDPISPFSHFIFLVGAILGVVGISIGYFGTGRSKEYLWIGAGIILTVLGFMIASHSIAIARSSTFSDRRSEDVRVVTIVIAELEFSDIERQIFVAHLVECPDHAALDQRPKALNRVRVNRADDVLAGVMVDLFVRVGFAEPRIAFPLVGAKQADFVRDGFVAIAQAPLLRV